MCPLCQDTGTIDTGNNDLPCSCPAGARAVFNVVGVNHPVTGAEVRQHYLNDSPDPRPAVAPARRAFLIERHEPQFATDYEGNTLFESWGSTFEVFEFNSEADLQDFIAARERAYHMNWEIAHRFPLWGDRDHALGREARENEDYRNAEDAPRGWLIRAYQLGPLNYPVALEKAVKAAQVAAAFDVDEMVAAHAKVLAQNVGKKTRTKEERDRATWERLNKRFGKEGQ